MSQENVKVKEDGFIDNIAKELYGYDDATLQKEMDKAEAAWEQQKSADSEAESQSLEATQRNFKVIMGKIEEQGIRPVSRNTYVKQQKEGRQKVVKLKTFLKAGVAVATLCLLLMGMTWRVWCLRLGTEKNRVNIASEKLPHN